MLRILFHRAASLYTDRFVEGFLLKRHRERFWFLIGGHIFFQILQAAIELDLFTLLSEKGPLTRSEIASHLGLQGKPARILLLGLTATGLVRKRGDRYTNGIVAERVLTRHSPRGLIPVVRWEHHIVYKAMFHFLEALKVNRNVGLKEFQGEELTLYERLSHDPERERIFQEAMSTLSKQANLDLARLVDFSRFRHLVDVGGGDGTNLILLARQYPRLHGMVFDLPSAIQIAEENIRRAGLFDRLKTFSGDCFKDPYPKGADVFLFAHFLTIWSEEKDRLLLKKAFEALSGGGSVILFNTMQNDDETGPFPAAMTSPYFLTLATGEGMLYTWAEYEAWMREAGFSSVRRIWLPRYHGVIMGTKT